MLVNPFFHILSGIATRIEVHHVEVQGIDEQESVVGIGQNHLMC